jgi:hypothetical protein
MRYRSLEKKLLQLPVILKRFHSRSRQRVRLGGFLEDSSYAPRLGGGLFPAFLPVQTLYLKIAARLSSTAWLHMHKILCSTDPHWLRCNWTFFVTYDLSHVIQCVKLGTGSTHLCSVMWTYTFIKSGDENDVLCFRNLASNFYLRLCSHQGVWEKHRGGRSADPGLDQVGEEEWREAWFPGVTPTAAVLSLSCAIGANLDCLAPSEQIWTCRCGRVSSPPTSTTSGVKDAHCFKNVRKVWLPATAIVSVVSTDQVFEQPETAKSSLRCPHGCVIWTSHATDDAEWEGTASLVQDYHVGHGKMV